MATPRQRILADTINIMYAAKIERTDEGVEKALTLALPHCDKSSKVYFGKMSEKSIGRMKVEVLQYLSKEIILDYSDFEPGGRYAQVGIPFPKPCPSTAGSPWIRRDC